MLKRKSFAFNKDIYFLGTDKNGVNYWLEAAKWNCGWYWGGGYVVIGVEEENGRPVYPLKGVQIDKIDAYQKSILAKCKLIRPAYMPIIEVVDYQEKKFIVLWCPGGETRPYSSPKTMEKDNKERIHYIRKGSNTIEPSDEDEKELFGLANRVPFDDRVNHQADLSDLNIALIQNYLKEVGSSLYEKANAGNLVEVCRDMNIISNLPEYMKPKNVGLMFFSMEPDKFFPYTQIDVVQFPGGLGGNDIIEKTFKGPIQQQLRDALQYIRNVIITGSCDQPDFLMLIIRVYYRVVNRKLYEMHEMLDAVWHFYLERWLCHLIDTVCRIYSIYNNATFWRLWEKSYSGNESKC